MKTRTNWLVKMGIIITAFTLIFCSDDPVAPKLLPVQLLYEETFEGLEPFSTAYHKEVGDWDYALQYVNSPAYTGTKSARFEIRVDQPLIADGKRAEVSIVRGALGQIEKDTWYSFAVYFPSVGYEYDHTHEVISQWYQDGSPVRLLTDKDKILLEVGNEKGGIKEEFEIGAITKDVWNEIVIHFIHSHGSDGHITLWYNGELTIDRSGGNMFDNILPKWQIGIYKSAFEMGTSDVSNRIIFFDNIKVGGANASYNHMIPK
jgi:hypothetical protein